MSEYLTSSQAARLLGVSRSTFHNWHASGKLEEYGVHPIQTLGGHYRYRREEIESLRNVLLNRASRGGMPAGNGYTTDDPFDNLAPDEQDAGGPEP